MKYECQGTIVTAFNSMNSDFWHGTNWSPLKCVIAITAKTQGLHPCVWFLTRISSC